MLLLRCLTACRDILPGELVLTERCLFWGPVQTPACVACLDTSCKLDYSLCVCCGYPLCPEHQEDPGIHQEECSLLAQAEGSALEDVEDQYLVLRVIRCLLYMADHKLDKSGVRGDAQVIGVEWLVELVKQVDQFKKEDILMAIDLVLYNCLDDYSNDGLPSKRGFYPSSNLVENSCISNTRNIIDGNCLECRATVHITAGQTITTCLVDPLLDVYTRYIE